MDEAGQARGVAVMREQAMQKWVGSEWSPNYKEGLGNTALGSKSRNVISCASVSSRKNINIILSHHQPFPKKGHGEQWFPYLKIQH